MSATVTGLLIAVGLILSYATSCLIWPYVRCWRCKGDGRFPAWWGRGFRYCGWCRGSGARMRIGRRIFSYVWNRRANR